MTLFYDNNKTAQDPIVTTADLFTSGTPVVTYEMKDQSNITSGMKRTLFITILLIKMSSPIKVELVTSVANRLPVMHILSFDVVHVGKNIKGLNNSATATFFTTTNDTSSRDQAALNLGIGVNESPSTANSTHNQIQLSCEVIAVENRNMTNSSSYSIASGLIAEPRLMWVGRFLINSYISSDRRPKLFLKYDFTENGDTYTFNVFINHTEHSDQVAYNVTLEYYLPPYLEFVNWTGDNSVQKQAKDTRFLVKKLFFTSEISNSITAILRKKKSPQTGEVDFVVPIRLQYTDVENTKKWRYWKSVKLSVEVPESPPIIGRSVKAKPSKIVHSLLLLFYHRRPYLHAHNPFQK
ncbi:uncharacterized protein LOC130635418 [Hydractinia symbiolongicarpus]|uniref:uncharacterized protein LOC130635418 n=1 Tax=Hydractinia symbiolongicarpus TaxID=13093 RepID=UPI00254BA8D7|nr:uncharacterized protein LOC130635418 [Hydractinia symbiolongicarpus]